MRRNSWMTLALTLGVLAGCNGSSSDSTKPQAGAEGKEAPAALASATPIEAVNTFLDAVRTGNDEVATAMFTPLAQQKANDLDIEVAPRGSDTAKFEVGKVEMLGEEGARVESKWTDMDRNGQPRSDDITWMLRRESQGWRVAGMAATVFDGEPPLLLDFEQPEETMRRLDLLREEVQRRMAKEDGQPGESQPPAAPGQPTGDVAAAEMAAAGSAATPPQQPKDGPGASSASQETARPTDPFQR